MKIADNVTAQGSFHVGDALSSLLLNALLKIEGDIGAFKPKDLHHTDIHGVIAELVKGLPEKPIRIVGTYAGGYAAIYEDFYLQIAENSDYVLNQSKTDFRSFLISGAGSLHKIMKYSPIIQKLFSRISYPRVEWWYNTKEDGTISKIIPLKTVSATPTGFYPWFNGDINAHLKLFIEDNASIMMLFGLPGTGKTSLLRSFIHDNNLTAIIAYEDIMLENDVMFLSFLNRNDDCVLLVEDADVLISSRQDGNKLITRFLNMADGILSTSGKKIIFTSNLNNYTNIDDALLRPGRCYDVIEFKALTQEQANNIAKMINKPEPKGQPHYTLAEVFNQKDQTHKVTSKVGFAA